MCMGSTMGRVVSGVATGGLSEVAYQGMKAMQPKIPGPVANRLAVTPDNVPLAAKPAGFKTESGYSSAPAFNALQIT